MKIFGGYKQDERNKTKNSAKEKSVLGKNLIFNFN